LYEVKIKNQTVGVPIDRSRVKNDEYYRNQLMQCCTMWDINASKDCLSRAAQHPIEQAMDEGTQDVKLLF